jgi:AbrB family looped-hinge helix DNA binding protein
MAIAKVSKKGWIVIPHEIRERYGIRPGDEIHVIDYAGRIAIIPVAKDPISAARGMLKGGTSMTKALLEERRREREREERDLQRWSGDTAS